MRKWMSIVLAVLIFMSVFACAPETVSDKEAQKVVENALGDYKQLPLDIEQVKNKLSEDVLVRRSEEGDNTEIVVGDNVAVYYSVIENTAESASGKAYRFKITLMHLGSAREGKDGEYDLHFIGANITMELEGEDVSAVRQELLSQVEQMELSQNDLAQMKDLINGKQVYADSGSHLWEMYSEVDVNVKATYDAETGTFAVREEDSYDEMYDQYSYEIKDFKGRTQKRVYYKIDDAGTKWITENYEYKYLPDGSVEEYSVSYWDYTAQIRSEDVTLAGKCLWQKSYRDDGTLEAESYYNDDGNTVMISYDNSGIISEKIIREGSPEGKKLCEEYYYTGGQLMRKYTDNGSTIVHEEYYENGYLASFETFDLSLVDEEHDRNGLILSKIGLEDGRYNVTEYHENGERKILTWYSAAGEVTDITYFDESGKVIR